MRWFDYLAIFFDFIAIKISKKISFQLRHVSEKLKIIIDLKIHIEGLSIYFSRISRKN